MKYLDNGLRGLAALLLFGAVVISYQEIPVWKLFLVKDFNSLDLSVLLNKDQNSLGQISELRGSGLKRRTLNEGFFNTLKINESVFGGDIVTTDNATLAVIKFNDGSTLEIQPGSMVKLDFHMDQSGLLKIAKNPKVEVFSGSVTGTGGINALKITNLAGQNLTVAAHSSNTVQAETKVLTAPTKISSDQLTRLNLPAPKPVVPAAAPVAVPAVAQAPVVPPSAPKVEVIPKAPPRKIASIPASAPVGLLDVEPPKIAGLKDLNSNIYQGEDMRSFFVDLKWEEVAAASSYNLEFFLDSGLTKPWFHVETGNNYYKLTQMFSGSVYYQVTAKLKNRVLSKTKAQVLTFNYHGPDLKNPKTGTQLQASESFYYFTWEKTNFTDKYVIEISKNPEFTKIIKKEIETNFIQIPLLSGTYYWRVSSKLGEVVSKPSKVNTLVIK
jgi:hypothetical protein